MAKTISFLAFANSVQQSASEKGKSARQLSLQLVQGKDASSGQTPEAGPNDHLFDDVRRGQGSVNLMNLNREAIAGFEGGKQYRVTIEEVE